jgi:predicted ATPase/class 3 adenylate cyclase
MRCFVFTDIEGSTRAWEMAAPDMERRLDRHDQVLREIFARHDGRVFSTGGDGFAVVFDDVVSAVVSAVELQAALTGGSLLVRVGIHVGHAVERDGDFFGSTLNRTARIMSAGHGGQILLSEAAAALARPFLSDGVEVIDLGIHQLRDLTDAEHVWELRTVSNRRVFPPLRTAGALATNLPTAEPLIGRRLDVDSVVEMVRSHRLVTVTGPGGVGKSSLALAVAHQLAGESNYGTWLVELAPLADSAGLIGAVAGVLPLSTMPTTAIELVEQIGSREMLVVLDNCEHLVEEVALLVSQLLAACPGVRLLCTSQETLALERENTWPLRPLTDDAAKVLFERRTRAVRPDVVPDPAAVDVIVRRLDGLPLAIELAAARVSTFSSAEIAAQLDDRFQLLSGGMRGQHPRHRGLAAMVDWGYEVLEPDAQRLFRRLGIFAGTFSRDAAIHVGGTGWANPAAVADELHHLVRRSLVVADVNARTTRYRLLETLRHYTLDRLAEVGETETIGREHAEWYAEHALAFEGVASPDETRWLAHALAEFDNLRAAVAFAVGHVETDLAIRLVGRLWRLHVLWRAELLDWARQVLALPGAADHPDVGYVHSIVATLAWIIGARDESERATEEALQRDLNEDAWTDVCLVRQSMLGHRNESRAAGAVIAGALKRVKTLPNRVMVESVIVGSEGYTGIRHGVEAAELIARADRTGIPAVRSFARTMCALSSVPGHRSLDAVGLLDEAFEIVHPGLNRWAVGLANEIGGLVRGAATETPDELADLAARALDLGREYPVGMGLAIVGLIVKADRDGREADTAMLAGYLTANLGLLIPATSAEVMAGGPLERFVTPATQVQFARGKAMTNADLRRELQRLADL